jgi:hypothetical protein
MKKNTQPQEEIEKQLYQSVHEALSHWHKPGLDSEALINRLLCVQQVGESLKAGENPDLLRQAINQVLSQAIEDMAAQYLDYGKVLKLRFFKGLTITQVAEAMSYDQYHISRLQRSGIEQLVKILLGREREIKLQRMHYLESLLPPATYSQLFGVDELCQTLVAQLMSPQEPWVVALVGMGGLGKTAVSHYVTLRLLKQLDISHLAWIKIDPPHTMSGLAESPSLTHEKIVNELLRQLFPEEPPSGSLTRRETRLRRALRSQPHLIVIDNLETEKDTAFLLNHLTDLANPSKFLLTTRTRVVGQAAIREIRLDELAQSDSLALMRYHGRIKGIQEVTEAADADLLRIYEQIGGNPYALKMVVDLLGMMTLNKLLDGLIQGHPQGIIDIYMHIFRQAWRTLSDNGRKLLRAMPLVPDSSDVDYLLTISGLAESEIWPAIEELRQRSLLEVEGGLHEKKYGIHRLTDTFLRTEIIHFPL